MIRGFKKIKIPDILSFIKNSEGVICLINLLEKSFSNHERVFLNLTKVVEIDYGAITVLLSVMFKFKKSAIEFIGNYPKNKTIKNLLIQSGFFKYLNKPLGVKIEYSIGNPNQMFTQANKMVVSDLGLPIMSETTNTIWGEKRICKGLQRVLVELMQNTNNHANINAKGKERWWLSVNHEKELKRVSFVFVDYGIGVFQSLKNKPKNSKWFGMYEKFSNFFNNRNNAEILEALLNGELHLTVTGEDFRGKGLPGICQVFKRNQISSLHIITNNVFSDVSGKNYNLMNEHFNGTFVYWEINSLNENLEWTI